MKRFVRSHVAVPLVLLTIALGIDIYWGLDLRLADLLFFWEGSSWALKNHWFTSTVVHTGGRRLVGLMLFMVFLALALSYKLPKWREYRRGLAYLLVTILISFLLVNGLKAVSGVPCPWDFEQYGGNSAPHEWFSGFSGEHGCFPAGHASGGYVWITLYFFALAYRVRHKYWILAIGMGLGLTFGISQQLRGAHFLSHDLVTLTICWFTALVGFLLCFRQNKSDHFY